MKPYPSSSDQIRQYWDDAAQEYSASAYNYGTNPDVRYPLYEIRQERVFELLGDRQKGRLLDAGCGGGSMVLECLKLGWEAHGCDFSENMVKIAQERLTNSGQNPERIRLSSVSELSDYYDETFNVVLSLGVMEYVPPEEDTQAYLEARRVLSPGGLLIVENINALFDLTTFNRFTVNFFRQHLLPRFFSSEARVDELASSIANLLTYPEKPDRDGVFKTTRDEVFTKTENPLTFPAKMEKHGFRYLDTVFYRFHSVPPLLFPTEPDLEKVAIEFESQYCRDWIGYFLASGFLSVVEKQ